MDLFTRQAARIDRRALEVLVPVGRITDEPASDVLLPERRAAIDAEPVEAETVHADLRGAAKRRSQVLFGLVRDANDEESVNDFDAGRLRVADRRLDLGEGLLLLEAVEALLATALDAEHHCPATRLR